MVYLGPYLPQSLIAVVDKELMIINTGRMPMKTPMPTVRKARVIGERLFMRLLDHQSLLYLSKDLCCREVYNLHRG